MIHAFDMNYYAKRNRSKLRNSLILCERSFYCEVKTGCVLDRKRESKRCWCVTGHVNQKWLCPRWKHDESSRLLYYRVIERRSFDREWRARTYLARPRVATRGATRSGERRQLAQWNVKTPAGVKMRSEGTQRFIEFNGSNMIEVWSVHGKKIKSKPKLNRQIIDDLSYVYTGS